MASELAKVTTQLDLLLKIVSEQDPDNVSKWKGQIDAIRTQYTDAEAIVAKDPNGSNAKYAKDVCEAISKNLPNFVKGTQSAVAAFRKGDNISGTAAIFDIFAAATPILTNIFAAAGPEGMLVGAIFSLIGQILSFWAPQQEKLTDQIKRILLDIEAERMITEAHAVTTAVQLYAIALRSVAKMIPVALTKGQHIQNDVDAGDWATELRMINDMIEEARTTFLNSNMTSWTVQDWLNTDTKQDLDKWPEVLAAYCHMNADLRSAQMICQCSIDDSAITALYVTLRNPASPLDENRRLGLEGLLSKLLASLGAIRLLDDQRNKMVDEYLEQFRKPARSWGFYSLVGGKGYLHVCAGPKATRNGEWVYLEDWPDRVGSGAWYVASKSIVPYAEDVNKLHPRYHCFLQRASTTYHRTLVAKTPPENYGDVEIADVNGASNDWNSCVGWAMWAIPAPLEMGGLRIFHAIDQTILHHWTNGVPIVEGPGNTGIWANDGTRNWSLEDAKSRVVAIRAVYPESVFDDPDGDIQSVFDAGSTDFSRVIIYGALEKSTDIYVIKGSNPSYGYVPKPWNIDSPIGLGVDKHYLWVCSPWSIACASHTSIIHCINERKKGNSASNPRWMYCNLSDQSIGLTALAACDDGTVTITGAMDYANGSWNMSNGQYFNVFEAAHHVDIKAGNMGFPGGWTRFGGGGWDVEKQPSYCWPLLNRLIAP